MFGLRVIVKRSLSVRRFDRNFRSAGGGRDSERRAYTMEVESAESGGGDGSEAHLQAAAAPDDVNVSLPSRSAVESDALLDVSSHSAPIDNDDSAPAQSLDQDTSQSAAETVESPASGDDIGPSAAAATSFSDFNAQEVLDSSTQWNSSGSTAGMDTDKSSSHVDVLPHPASVTAVLALDVGSPSATTTTTTPQLYIIILWRRRRRRCGCRGTADVERQDGGDRRRMW